MIPSSFRLLLALPALLLSAQAGNWPQFRGPSGDGLAPDANPPLDWAESRNVAWKTPIHDKGWSSPVVWGDTLWLTTATEDGRRLFVLAVDRVTGKVVHDLALFEANQSEVWKRYNSYASPTPVVEEGRVYVSFGEAATACLDSKSGKVLWERRDLHCNHYRGAGSSPVVHGDLLFLNFDGADAQFVVALDKRTGKTAWKRDRSLDYRDLGPDGKPEAEGDFRKAFATVQVGRFDGVEHLVSQGAKAVYGYEPLTGRELWRIEERTSHSGGTRPVVGRGMVFLPTGWSQGQTLAIRPGRSGEVLDVNAGSATNSGALTLAWRSKRGTPKKPSLTLVGDLLIGIEDGGVATCWEAATGEVVWSERLGGNYSASPVVAQGRLYCVGQDGNTVVVEASRTFRKLAENKLEEGCMASPAVAGDSLFLRTKSFLYRLEGPAR
jgi:outer membrane protein assembly factor BamB